MNNVILKDKCCEGITKKNTPCKKRIQMGYKFCYYHKDQSSNDAKDKYCLECNKPIIGKYTHCYAHRDLAFTRCIANTEEGTQCPTKVKIPYKVCYAHRELLKYNYVEKRVNCVALTVKGVGCRNTVLPSQGSKYCGIHKEDERKLFEKEGKEWPPKPYTLLVRPPMPEIVGDNFVKTFEAILE